MKEINIKLNMHSKHRSGFFIITFENARKTYLLRATFLVLKY